MMNQSSPQASFLQAEKANTYTVDVYAVEGAQCHSHKH